MKSTVDYQLLWNSLKIALEKMGVDHASRAMTEPEIRKIRQHQGAFRFARDALATMDRLHEEALHPGNSVDAN